MGRVISPIFLEVVMTEQEYNILIQVYQKKLNEVLTQSIALESRVVFLNQQINSLNEEISRLTKSSSRKKTSDEFS